MLHLLGMLLLTLCWSGLITSAACYQIIGQKKQYLATAYTITLALTLAMTVLYTLFLLSSPVSAQERPSYALPQVQPQNVVRGVYWSQVDKYHIYVKDVNGYIDSIELYQGTVINPTGITLVPGMALVIYGEARDRVFFAHQIDTIYGYAVPIPRNPWIPQPIPYPPGRGYR
jgi:hypothetical protein